MEPAATDRVEPSSLSQLGLLENRILQPQPPHSPNPLISPENIPRTVSFGDTSDDDPPLPFKSNPATTGRLQALE